MDLIDAVNSNNEKIVLDLLLSGVNPMRCDDPDMITPLHHAVLKSSDNIIAMLTFFGADPNYKTCMNDESPLDRADQLPRTSAIQLMRFASGNTTLH